jgi:glycosyltransferase involved in cell wall biosynthesis
MGSPLLKVLHLIGERVDLGGVLSVVRNVQEATRTLGCEHRVWVHHGFRQTRAPELELRRARFISADAPSAAVLAGRALLSWAGLRALLSSESFDVLHAHSRGGLLAGMGVCRWLNRQLIFTNHAYARRVSWYARVAQSRRVHSVLLSPNMARHYGIPLDAPRVSIVSDCCADEFFAEPLRSASPPGDRNPLRLIGVGNIVRWKQWDVLIKALGKLSQGERSGLQFRHCGTAPPDRDAQRYQRELLQLIEHHDLKSSLVFLGQTSRVADELRDSHWFVLPSTNEPCSVALIEALAFGVPALVSDSGGNVDILAQPGCGLRFRSGDVDDLAAKLRDLLAGRVHSAPPEVIRESVRARSASAVGAQYVRMYREVAELEQREARQRHGRGA